MHQLVQVQISFVCFVQEHMLVHGCGWRQEDDTSCLHLQLPPLGSLSVEFIDLARVVGQGAPRISPYPHPYNGFRFYSQTWLWLWTGVLMLEQFTVSSAHPYYVPVFIFIELALGFHRKIVMLWQLKSKGIPAQALADKRGTVRCDELFRRPQFFTSKLWSSVPLSRVPCVTASHPFFWRQKLPAQNMASPYFKPSKHIQRRSFVQKTDKTVKTITKLIKLIKHLHVKI